MTILSQAIQIGPLTIRFYSLTMIAGILLGTQLFSRFGKEKGIAPETADRKSTRLNSSHLR